MLYFFQYGPSALINCFGCSVIFSS
uniref:Uncharacterized protein n=1 Tax=Arundo donax TaxID=35708 RepID=A0A0A9HBF1_ARUDO